MSRYVGERTFELIGGRSEANIAPKVVRRSRSMEWHLMGTMCMIAAVWFVFQMTGISPMSGFSGKIHGGVNLLPFQGIVALIDDGISNQSIGFAAYNIVGNIILFVPVGFLLPMLYGGYRKFWKVTLFGAVLSCMIECWQLFLTRATDVDDIMLNIIGTMLGFILYAFFEKKAVRFCKRFRRKTVIEPIVITIVMAMLIVGAGFYQRIVMLGI